MGEKDKILSVKDLELWFDGDYESPQILNKVSFDVYKGETLGIAGESGCGKSVTSLSILRLLKTPPARLEGEINFQGQNLLELPMSAMRKIRGNKITMIFQEPMTSLNPLLKIGYQISEVLRLHQGMTKKQAHEKAIEMLRAVRVALPEKRVNEFPYQLSGGMRQRVMIAMALACNPELLIADEPTTALDVTIQAQVLELMKKLKAQYQTAMVMITHDLGIVAEICDYVAIMYAGEVVEYGTREHIFNSTAHPYTKGLFACIPDIFTEQNELVPINGLTPDPTDLPQGCRFNPRCPYATERCRQEHPENVEIEPGHFVACHLINGGGNENA